MKIRLARIIGIPVPDDIIEHVEPCIDYYQRADGEHMMEGAVEITMSYLVDATTTDSLPF